MTSSNWRRYLAFLRYALPFKKLVAAHLSLMLLSIGFGLLKPWPLKVLVDHVVGGQPLVIAHWRFPWSPGVLLALTCAAYLVFHAGESLVQVFSTVVSTLTSSRMIRQLRSDLVNCLQRLSLRFHDSHRVGDLVYRVTYNTSAVESAFQSGFMGAVKSSLNLLGMFFIMLLMSPLLTAVAMAVVPALIVAIRWYAKRIHRVSLEHQNQEGEVSSRTHEILSNIRLVQAFNRRALEQQRFDSLCERSVDTRLKTTMVQRGFGFATALILALGTVLLFWVGIHQVLDGVLTIGEFLVFNAYLAMLYGPLSVLSYTASSVQSALGGGARLFEILESEDEIEECPDAEDLDSAQGAVSFSAVDFGYENHQPVLHQVSFAIAPGEMAAVVGETGGGKTTLLNLLLRFYDPWSGSIQIDGKDIRTLTLESLRGNLALVPQEPLLLADTIRENIAYGNPAASDEEILHAARMADADTFIQQLPDGYDTSVGERGVRLSAGQRQRIAIARAFVKKPRILILDEPTSALDAETESHLRRTIEQLKSHCTVVVVTHRLFTIRNADRIHVLHQGRVVEEGPHEHLLARRGVYARLWESQTSEVSLSPRRVF